MNRYKKYFSLLAVISLTLASCLKDKVNNSDPAGGSNNVVEFQNTSVPVSYTSIYPQYNYGTKLVNDTSSFRINFNWAGAQETAPQDITINFTRDSLALDAFDTDQNKAYILPPADVVSYPTSVTIPKGSSGATIIVKITKAADWSYADAYALAFTITSASYGTVSTNFGTAIFSFGDLNKYDGQYALRERLVGWGGFGIADGTTNNWGNNIDFVTASPTTSTTWDPGGEQNLQLAFTTGGGGTAFGATTPLYTFDPATDALTAVVNTTPDDGRGRALMINPAVTDSRYDADKKIIYAAYIMVQTGRPPQYIYDTLTYKGAR